MKRDGRLYDDEGDGDGLEKVIAEVAEREVEEMPEEGEEEDCGRTLCASG